MINKTEDHIALEQPLIATTKDAGTIKNKDKPSTLFCQNARECGEKFQEKTVKLQDFTKKMIIHNGQPAQKIEARKFMEQLAKQETPIMNQPYQNCQHVKESSEKLLEQIALQEIFQLMISLKENHYLNFHHVKEKDKKFQELLALQEIHSLHNKANSSEMEDHIAPELLLTVITKDAGTIKKQDKHFLKTMTEDHIVLEQLLTATIKDAGTIKSKVKLLLRMISLIAMVLPLVQTIKDANGQKKQPLSNYQHVKVKLVNFLEKIALLSPILANTEKTRKP